MPVHHTKPENAAVHNSGWFALPGTDYEVTALALVDTCHALPNGEHLFARLDYDSALEVAARETAELIDEAEFWAMEVSGLVLTPYLGTPIAENDIVHSERHDADIWRQLKARGWDGKQVVVGDGKYWQHGAPPGRSRLIGWDKDGNGPGKILWQPSMVAHNRLHFDDGTTTKLRRKRAATVVPAPPTPAAPPPEKIDFILARNFTPANRIIGDIRLVVLHSTENSIRGGVARGAARWFSGPSAPRASAHYIVGPEETVACVREHNVAWAAPGANRDGIQIEQVGQALRTDWLMEGLPVLERSARLVAQICARWQIPIERVDAAGLLAGRRGITTHAAVTAAYKKSSHIDPGGATDSRWPWGRYLDLCRGHQ